MEHIKFSSVFLASWCCREDYQDNTCQTFYQWRSKTPSRCDSDDCRIISLIMSSLSVTSSTARDFCFLYFSLYLLFLALGVCFVFEWINECLNEENDTKNWSPIYKDTNVHLEWLVCASLTVRAQFYIVTFTCVIVFYFLPDCELLTHVALCPWYSPQFHYRDAQCY